MISRNTPPMLKLERKLEINEWTIAELIQEGMSRLRLLVLVFG